MSTTRIALLVLMAGLTGAPTVGLAQGNCDWYAKTAVRQQQINETQKCGLNGLSWHTDLPKHLAWCQSVPPDTWKSEARKRDAELAACPKR